MPRMFGHMDDEVTREQLREYVPHQGKEAAGGSSTPGTIEQSASEEPVVKEETPIGDPPPAKGQVFESSPTPYLPGEERRRT